MLHQHFISFLVHLHTVSKKKAADYVHKYICHLQIHLIVPLFPFTISCLIIIHGEKEEIQLEGTP